MAEIEDKSDAVQIQLKMLHFKEMISLYKKYSEDVTELQNKLIEAQKEYAVKFGFASLKTYDEIQKNKKLQPTGTDGKN